MRIKAAILTELNRPLTVDEIQSSILDVGQVLVKVHASGICGAQIGEITGAKGPDKWLPHLLGHEGGGVVLQVGLGVTRVKPGDHVVMHWRKGAGIDAVPPKYKWGDKTVGGGWVTTFNDHAVVSENRLTVIDKDIPFDVAALMGCAVTTALGLVCNEAKVKIGESVVVAGCGGVGLNVIQAAILAGAYPVVGIDRSRDARIRANSAGASFVLHSEGDLELEIRKVVGSNGADVFVDCTGSCDMIALGYEVTKASGGRLILVGQPHHEQCLTLPLFRKHYCGKTVMDSQGGLTEPNVDIPRYMRLYKAGRLDLGSFITHRFPLERVNDAIALIRNGEVGRCILEMP